MSSSDKAAPGVAVSKKFESGKLDCFFSKKISSLLVFFFVRLKKKKINMKAVAFPFV